MAKNMEQVLTTFQMVLTMSGIGKTDTDMEMGFILSKMGQRKQVFLKRISLLEIVMMGRDAVENQTHHHLLF